MNAVWAPVARRTSRQPARLLLCSLAVALVTACSGVAGAPSPVRAVLGPLTDQGFTCAGPGKDQSSYLQWTCTRTTGDQTTWTVVIDGNESVVKQVVGEGSGVADGSLGSSEVDAFFRLLAGLPQTPGATSQVLAWVTSHTASGGQGEVGPMFVQIEPGSQRARISLFMRSSPGLIALRTQPPEPTGTPEACAAALLIGTIVRDATSGVALRDQTGQVHQVVWRYGYAARDDGGRLVVIDDSGTVVAHEGDRVSIGGGETGADGTWSACGETTILP